MPEEEVTPPKEEKKKSAPKKVEPPVVDPVTDPEPPSASIDGGRKITAFVGCRCCRISTLYGYT